MHKYEHTIQGKGFELLYISMGILSLVSTTFSLESDHTK